MIPFLDRFNPSTWQDNGIITVQQPVESSQPRVQMRKAATIASVMVTIVVSITAQSYSAAINAGNICGTSGSVHSENIFARTPDVAHRPPGDNETPSPGIQIESPQGADYINPSSWPGLMKQIDNLPEFHESDDPDPEPFF